MYLCVRVCVLYIYSIYILYIFTLYIYSIDIYISVLPIKFIDLLVSTHCTFLKAMVGSLFDMLAYMCNAHEEKCIFDGPLKVLTYDSSL